MRWPAGSDATTGATPTSWRPPVDVSRGSSPLREPAEDFFLLVSGFVPYKRDDIALESFRRSGKATRRRRRRARADGALEQARVPRTSSSSGRVDDADPRRALSAVSCADPSAARGFRNDRGGGPGRRPPRDRLRRRRHPRQRASPCRTQTARSPPVEATIASRTVRRRACSSTARIPIALERGDHDASRRPSSSSIPRPLRASAERFAPARFDSRAR